jgi:cytoskeletal protein CcmA (bactofilin family)
MGIFDKKTQDTEKAEERAAPEPYRDSSIRPRRDCECYIAEGTTVEGKITGSSSVGIDGLLDGELNIASKLVIGESGELKGKINADDVVISGKVTGDINVKSLLEVHPPGQIFGDIKANRLVIDDGVLFEGNITMSRESAPKKMPKKGSGLEILEPKEKTEPEETPPEEISLK